MSKGYSFQLSPGQPHMNVARLVKERAKHFEVAIDPDLAMKFKDGAISDVRDALKSEEIFLDVKKGLRPTENELKDSFGTTDKIKVAEEIIRKGIVQVSDQYRQEQRELKKRKIIDTICRNCVDPASGLPHPPQRVENAITEAKAKIDDHKSAEDQVQDVIKQIRAVLPIKFETKEMEVKIPFQYASRSHNIVKQFGTVIKENWEQDGSYSCTVDIPAGMQNTFFDKVNAATHGEAEIKITKTK